MEQDPRALWRQEVGSDGLSSQRFLFPPESGTTPETLFPSPEGLELAAPSHLFSPSKRLHEFLGLKQEQDSGETV